MKQSQSKSAGETAKVQSYTTITIDEATASKLRAAAERLGIEPEKLLEDSLASLFKDSDETVIAAVKGGVR